jgi:amidase
MLYEFKAGLNKYLEQSGAAIGSLEEIIAFNSANADTVMPHFGQDILELSQSKGALEDDAYVAALQTSRSGARKVIDEALAEHSLDALIAITNGPAWLTDHINGDAYHVGSSSYAAVSGYPNITVPAGFISGLPIGLSFIGPAFSEKALIEIAYAFEQATLVRRPPEL